MKFYTARAAQFRVQKLARVLLDVYMGNINMDEITDEVGARLQLAQVSGYVLVSPDGKKVVMTRRGEFEMKKATYAGSK